MYAQQEHEHDHLLHSVKSLEVSDKHSAFTGNNNLNVASHQAHRNENLSAVGIDHIQCVADPQCVQQPTQWFGVSQTIGETFFGAWHVDHDHC